LEKEKALELHPPEAFSLYICKSGFTLWQFRQSPHHSARPNQSSPKGWWSRLRGGVSVSIVGSGFIPSSIGHRIHDGADYQNGDKGIHCHRATAHSGSGSVSSTADYDKMAVKAAERELAEYTKRPQR
jgi:hypothetical protein